VSAFNCKQSMYGGSVSVGQQLSPLASVFVPGVRCHEIRTPLLSSPHATIFEHLRTYPKVTMCLNVWEQELECDIDKVFY
jgi:hypothetical protein